MKAFTRNFKNFASFKRIPLTVVLGTAAASFILQLGMIAQSQPLYIIALFGLLPWLPVLMFESIWKIEHYHWIAIFGVVMFLQIGHVGEHVVQVATLTFTNGTLACPPPVDDTISAQRAIDAGLRSPASPATGLSAATIVKPNASGEALRDSSGELVTGPHACGVFGQLDLEIVHLVWEIIGWLLTLMLLTQFPRNRWLWVSIFWASVHTVEHLFISYTFFLDPVPAYEGFRQIWATIADGNLVTAYPVGLQAADLTFYDVAGKYGIVAKNGLIGTFFPALNAYLPARPYLHFYYNTIVTVPALIGFLLELRRAYDRYLKRALPQLTTQELVAVTPDLVPLRYKPGATIIAQGAVADSFFIISKGEVEVVYADAGGNEHAVAQMGVGDYFGEVGLVKREGRRIATVRALNNVEVLRLHRLAFTQLLNTSAPSKQQIEQVVAQRMAELKA